MIDASAQHVTTENPYPIARAGATDNLAFFHQERIVLQLLRFMDSQMFFKSDELIVLLRGFSFPMICILNMHVHMLVWLNVHTHIAPATS